MATISFLVPPPASQEEYKPFDITVRLTYKAPDAFGEGTFYVNLNYGGTTVWSDSQFVDGLTPGFFEQYVDETFTIGTQYSYTGAEIFTYFDPNSGGNEYISQSIDITADVTSPTVVSSSGSVG